MDLGYNIFGTNGLERQINRLSPNSVRDSCFIRCVYARLAVSSLTLRLPAIQNLLFLVQNSLNETFGED